MIHRLPASASLMLAAALTLAACAAPSETVSEATPSPSVSTPSAEPEPSPSPTIEVDAPPAVEDLVLRPDGIGDLVIGTAEGIGDEPDDMIRFEDDYCVGTRGEGFPPAGSPEADAWVLVDEYRVGETFAFGSAVVDGLLVAVQVGLSSAVRTEAGIGLASTRVEVLEAYPGASLVLAGPITDVYEVVGHGRLLIEVTRAGELIDATSGPGPDEVVALHAVAVDAEPFAVWGSDYVMFPCM